VGLPVFADASASSLPDAFVMNAPGPAIEADNECARRSARRSDCHGGGHSVLAIPAQRLASFAVRGNQLGPERISRADVLIRINVPSPISGHNSLIDGRSFHTQEAS
jgi:hypothetical protein